LTSRSPKGWIEAAGALVAVFGGAIGFYLQVLPTEPDKPDRNPVAAIALNLGRGTNVVGSQHDMVDQTAIGYTVEQYEHSLKAREQELREAAKPESGKSEEQRKAIERQLQAVQGQLGNLKKSYDERVAELNPRTAELELCTAMGQIRSSKRLFRTSRRHSRGTIPLSLPPASGHRKWICQP